MALLGRAGSHWEPLCLLQPWTATAAFGAELSSSPAFIPGQQLLSSPMEIPPKVQPLAGLREFSWGGIEGLGCDPLLGKLGFMERWECTEPSELSWKVLLELWLLLWKGPNTGNSLWDQGTGTRRAETRPWLCHGLRIALRVSLKVTSKKISS